MVFLISRRYKNAAVLIFPITGIGAGGFPQNHLVDGKTTALHMLEDHPGQDFRGWMFLQGQKSFVILLQQGDDRVILVQEKIVIQDFVHIVFDTRLDLSEIADHALCIELFLRDGDCSPDAVSMQIPAFAGMIHQPVSVTEIDLFSNCIHKIFALFVALVQSTIPEHQAELNQRRKKATPLH